MVDGMPVGCLFARPELDDHYGRVSIDADVHLFRDHRDRLRIRLAELIQHFFFALDFARQDADVIVGKAASIGVPVRTENSVRINQHPCGTLIADLVDALSLLASTSESNDWQSLPRPVVDSPQSAGSPCRGRMWFWINKSLVGQIKEKRHFRSRKTTIDATGFLRLSGASLISVV